MRILIDNALTHTPEGTAIKVGIQTATDNGSASLVVTDDGPGIDARSRDRVFERFYTGDEVSGSGLGLAIGRELALRMGGTLGLRGHRGRTEFELRLPSAGTGTG
jgi:signal transduction histidine kinase